MSRFQNILSRKAMTSICYKKGYVYLLLILTLDFAASNTTTLPIPDEFSNVKIRISILKFIEKMKNEQPFETLVVFMNQISNTKQRCLMEELLAEVQLPVVLINRETSYEYREKLNSKILLVRCFSKSKANELFEEFQAFPVQTNFRVLYIFEDVSAAMEVFQQYCNATQEFHVVNMLAISMDFSTTKTYLRCRNLDRQEVELKQFTDSSLLYEDRLRDLEGIEIRTLEDLLEPRTMLDEDKHGNRILGGYVGQLLQEFVRKHNATLKSINEDGANNTIFYEVIQNITHEGLLDIGATLIIPLSAENFNELTYPYELSSYCFMVPTSPDIPLQQIFTHIVKPSIFGIFLVLLLIFGILFTYIIHGGSFNFRTVLLNDRSIRGLLGQSFPMPRRSTNHFKCVLILICFTSIMVNTMYVAYLQAFLGHPPTESPLLTVNDIIASGKKVVVARDELFIFRNVPGFSMERSGHLFEIINNFQEFTQHRARLNTNFVYPVSRTRWLVFEEQQQLFARQLFSYTDICILPFMMLCLPIPKNSRYREAIERVILQIRDSGLLRLWMSWNFYEMVRLKRTSLDDLSTANVYGLALGMNDFYWIWCMYIAGISLSLLWFCYELIKWRWRRY